MCDLGQRLRQIAIALVGDDDRGPVSATRKLAPVRPTSADEEFFAQDRARLGQQLLGLR